MLFTFILHANLRNFNVEWDPMTVFAQLDNFISELCTLLLLDTNE